MSHKAVSWALDQKNLKPAPWIVLIHLADRHNKDTKRCDPDQARLAADCNMSRSTLNLHLKHLESVGLIRRVPRQDPKTRKMLSTFYILARDFGAPPEVPFAVSETRTREARGQSENTEASRVRNPDADSVSEKSAIPCPKNGQSRVRKSDTNLVREPGIEPCAASGAASEILQNRIDEFLEAYPRPGFREAVGDALATALEVIAWDELLARVKAFASINEGNELRFLPYPENWLSRREWERVRTRPDPAEREAVALLNRAKLIRSGNPGLCRGISPAQARAALEAGHVDEAQCRAAGVL